MTPRYGAVVTARGPDYGIYMLTIRVGDTAQGWAVWKYVMLRRSKSGRDPNHISFALPKNGWYEIKEPLT